MGSQALVGRFSAAIERAYSRKGEEVDNQLDFDRRYPSFFKTEYDNAIRIVNAAGDVPLLKGLMKAYLDLFFKYAAHRNNVRYYRSDQTFFELFDRCTRISTDKQNLFKEWSAQLDSSDNNRLKLRFGALSQTYPSRIRALIPKPTPKPKLILDYLRDEFLKQRGYAPKSNDDLYDFDPYKGEECRKALEAQLAYVQQSWNACVKGNEPVPRALFHTALDLYRAYLALTAQQGLLQLFQVIKYLQDRLLTKRENMGTRVRVVPGDRNPLMCELYAMTCLQLLVIAQGKLVLPSNRETFTREERAYILKPLRDPAYTYLSNIEDRFTRPLGNVQQAFDLSKTFLDLMLLTSNQISNATLVPLAETLAIQKFWTDVKELTAKLEKAGATEVDRIGADPNNVRLAQRLIERLAIEVPLEGQALAVAYARVGASPGFHETLGTITIIDINPQNTGQFYVEYEALKPNLFLVNKRYIGIKVYGSRIYSVHKSTAGMMFVVAGMFLMMGFLPVFIEAGFAGLIYELMVFYAAGKLEDQAAEAHPVFGKIVGLAAMIVVPRPSFKPKVVEPPGLGGRPQVKGVVSVEAKGATAVEGKATRQIDEAWLDRATTKTDTNLRAIGGRAETTATAPKTQGAEKLVTAPTAREAGAVADESVAASIPPPRSRFDQQLQQQQSKRDAPRTDVPAPPTQPAGSAPPRRRQQQRQSTGVRLEQPVGATGESAQSVQSSASNPVAGRNTADRRTGDRRLDEPRGQQGARSTGGTATANPAVQEPVVIEVWQGRRGGQLYRIIGDRAKFEASQHGYHVYEYFDANGGLLYVGRSGSFQEGGARVEPLPKGTPEAPFNNWINRLEADHVNTTWINEATSVRVTSDLSQLEMLALEEVRIHANQSAAANWNFRTGDFTRQYGRTGANLHANAQSATTRPTATFSIRAFSARTR